MTISVKTEKLSKLFMMEYYSVSAIVKIVIIVFTVVIIVVIKSIIDNFRRRHGSDRLLNVCKRDQCVVKNY